ncbi:DsbC family protein, partial [Acinetobacter baumannii]
MSFTRSQIFLACALASSLLFSACSKENKPQKEDALTATAPATGEASTIIERNAKQ